MNIIDHPHVITYLIFKITIVLSEQFLASIRTVSFLMKAKGVFLDFIRRVVIIKGYYLSLVLRKPVFGVSDQVSHKRGCTATEDG